ncbi:hypothetical protein QJS10_CPB04g01709 [Acorus calamus]|uniref:Uncharacterized protein n=1 Tax=Acorus calamus TaxID=4465 RepID=A0AAV9F1H7_ACOCL|nr:hypothetical protein QJS10_CPB04g01709 [Acorus calamus]
MGDSREAWLKKVYYEKCPGCKLEQRKEAHLGLPFKELFYVWLVTLGTEIDQGAVIGHQRWRRKRPRWRTAEMEEEGKGYHGWVNSWKESMIV